MHVLTKVTLLFGRYCSESRYTKYLIIKIAIRWLHYTALDVELTSHVHT